MKIRLGFVSNSSSSSFVLCKDHFSSDQIEAIRNHYIYAKSHKFDDILKYSSKFDEWNIDELDHIMIGYTSMANFSMQEFFNKIGITDDQIIVTKEDLYDEEDREMTDEEESISHFTFNMILFESAIKTLKPKTLKKYKFVEILDKDLKNMEQNIVKYLKDKPIIIYTQ